MLKTGTKSLLFGIHMIWYHPYVVYKAWKILYQEKPNYKEMFCIIVHDWGYFGKPDLDGELGEKHPEFGAKLAGFFFGEEYRKLCLYHSRRYAKMDGAEPSKLCWADKYSLSIENKQYYLKRARRSGELKELRMTFTAYDPATKNISDEDWYDMIEQDAIQMGQTRNSDQFA